MKTLLVLSAALGGLVIFAAPAVADNPVEYVRFCTDFGAKYFAIPGTDICVNPDTGVTKRNALDGDGNPIVITSITSSQQGIVDAQTSAENARAAAQKAQMDADRATDGVALSLAMQPAIVTAGHSFGFSANVGTFGGKFALGLSGAYAVSDSVMFTGAFGSSFTGTTGGRAGINVSW